MGFWDVCNSDIKRNITLYAGNQGYYIYGSGLLTHIGYMNDILQTSSILSNPYPVDHILGVIIHLFCGFAYKVAFFIPPFFSFFYIFSMYLVGKTIFQNKMELIIFVTLSSILIFGNLELAFTPNSQAFLLTSLILYLTFKIYYDTNNKKYHILLILLCFLIVFYHPLVTLMIILILCLMHITQYILEKYNKKIFKKVNFTYTIFFTGISILIMVGISQYDNWGCETNYCRNIWRPTNRIGASKKC